MKIKLHTDFIDNVRIREALEFTGAEGFGLYVMGLTYAAQYNVDGILDKNDLKRIIYLGQVSSHRARRWVEFLVALGLWHEVDDQYIIDDLDGIIRFPKNTVPDKS